MGVQETKQEDRMGNVKPLVKRNIVKKRTTPFKRWQWHRHAKLGHTITWRKPKGIDSCFRRRFKGKGKMVNIGYGNNKKTRHLLPNGFKKFTINNVRELEVLMMHNRTYAAEVAHCVSARKRAQIVQRAAQLNIKVTNAHARLNTQESE